jgi:plastocyanin domain-containing protein
MPLLSAHRPKRSTEPLATTAASQTLIRVRGGYVPSVVHAPSELPIRLVFLREETAACSEQVLFPAFGRSTMLPAGRRVVVELPACAPGTYEFTCAMGVLRGRLVVS